MVKMSFTAWSEFLSNTAWAHRQTITAGFAMLRESFAECARPRAQWWDRLMTRVFRRGRSIVTLLRPGTVRTPAPSAVSRHVSWHAPLLNPLAFHGLASDGSGMALPSQPLNLTVEQVEALNKRLSSLRHDINGDLALIVASAELIKLSPASIPQRVKTLLEQPDKIRKKMDEFSADLERIFGAPGK